MLEDPGAPPRGQPPRGDPARLTPGRWPGVLPRQVKLFGWVSLLNDFASEMIYPLLPAFVTGVLGAGPQALGALDGAAEFAAAFVKLGAGRLADRVPLRGPMIVLGYFIAVVVRPVIAITGAAWQVIGLRVVDRLGEVGEVRGGSERAGQPSLTSSNLPRPSPISPLFGISAFYLLRMPDTLIILRSQELGVPVAIVPLLWAAVHVVRSSSSFLGGAASDRLGPGQTMWVGWLVYAMLAVGMARAGTAAAAWGLFLALGLVAGLTESPERALVARLAGTHQGSGFGLYHGITGFAALVGGVALGGVFQRYGAAPAFLASAAGGLALVFAWPVFAGGWRRGVHG